MDDTPDKLRRNVVVLSAVIVAIALFNLSFRPTGTLLGFAEVGNITPLKVWICLLAVLVYVFLRYWFDEATGQQVRAMAEEYRGFRYAALSLSLTQEITRYFLLRRAPRWLANFERFDEEGDLARRFEQHGAATSASVTASIQHPDDVPWKGDVGYTFEAIWGDHATFGRTGGWRYNYTLPAAVRYRIVALCGLRAITYSKASVDVIVPLALAGIAVLACLYKLGFGLASLQWF